MSSFNVAHGYQKLILVIFSLCLLFSLCVPLLRCFHPATLGPSTFSKHTLESISFKLSPLLRIPHPHARGPMSHVQFTWCYLIQEDFSDMSTDQDYFGFFPCSSLLCSCTFTPFQIILCRIWVFLLTNCVFQFDRAGRLSGFIFLYVSLFPDYKPGTN